MRDNLAQRLMWVIWPAFLVAGVGEVIFFTLFDPLDLHLFGNPPNISREAFYTFGFVGFWGLGIASSALTVFLGRSRFEVDRCPFDTPTRPYGCPKREAGDECSDHAGGTRA
jgi:hypothetical protein